MSSIERVVGSDRLGEVGVRDEALVSPDHPERLVAGRRGEPRREPARFADPRAVLGEPQPDRLHDVVGRGLRQPERPGHRPHQAGVVVDQLVPRALVTIVDAREQRRLIDAPW